MTEQYLIPNQTLTIEEDIKHSRFITVLFHCCSEIELKCALTNLKVEYPGANHYCYAFVASDPQNSIAIGSSDDGEPAGSAGRPMLATLQGSGIGEIGAIVVRYFGGTKLGVGGLVRAYSSGIKSGLPELATVTKYIRYSSSLICSYPQLNNVEYLINQFDGVIINKVFTDAIEVEFEIAKTFHDDFNRELATQTQGQLKAKFNV
ncbi:YigZ family protein [Shewanella sp. 10N.286.51.B7]|uniref:YigZ family protein n=1 Tax=Shewanella sp. 10N.286.51.B7 TaxID=1880836 RepID=UPI000C83C949|nr:YigZ family protein [Shewanella sp. 10N.286.51.B7]PMG74870.1 YigZ family protein [Shewanella sp. 10N.286.51.B7]